MSLSRLTRFVQDWDMKLHRWREPDVRHVLVCVRAPMNYVMMAPVCRRMAQDPRVQFYFTATPDVSRPADVYRETDEGLRVINLREAKLMKFDAFLAADFIWVSIPRGTRRGQMVHGVAGKHLHPPRSARDRTERK